MGAGSSGGSGSSARSGAGGGAGASGTAAAATQNGHATKCTTLCNPGACPYNPPRALYVCMYVVSALSKASTAADSSSSSKVAKAIRATQVRPPCALELETSVVSPSLCLCPTCVTGARCTLL